MVVTFLPATLEIGVMQERAGFAVDVHGAGAAQRHAAAELRAGHVEGVAEHPEQRHLRADVNGLGFAVQGESDGHGDLLGESDIVQQNPPEMKIAEISLAGGASGCGPTGPSKRRDAGGFKSEQRQAAVITDWRRIRRS